jgi:hypothetical protein
LVSEVPPKTSPYNLRSSKRKGEFRNEDVKAKKRADVALSIINDAAIASDSDSKREFSEPLVRTKAIRPKLTVKNSISRTRTVQMKKALARGPFPEATVDSDFFIFFGKTFRVLSRAVNNFDSEPIISIGAFLKEPNRELLTFEPSNSPELDHLFLTFKSKLEAASSLTRSLNGVNLSVTYVLNKIKTELSDYFLREKSVKFFLDNWKGETLLNDEGRKQPVIPLEAFVSARVGVCRHKTLVAANFLSRLMKEGSEALFPLADIFHFRFDTTKGPHAWICLKFNTGEIFSFDPALGYIAELTGTPFQVSLLFEAYGSSAVLEMQKRFLA